MLNIINYKNMCFLDVSIIKCYLHFLEQLKCFNLQYKLSDGKLDLVGALGGQ